MRWRKSLILLAAAAVGGSVLLWHYGRGALVPAYAVQAAPLVQTVVASGRVVTTSRVQVGSEITGTVVERRVREGDVVRAGEVLAVLRADEPAARLREAQAALQSLREDQRPRAVAALQQVEVQRRQTARELARRRELQAQRLLSQEALEQAIATDAELEAALIQARLRVAASAAGGPEERQLLQRMAAARAIESRTVLRAPAPGVVLARNVEPGDLVQPGRVLFELALVGPTEIRVPVDEQNLAVLRVGQSARVVADAWPQAPFDATVQRIAPLVDATRGTVDLWLAVDRPPAGLRQDMTVSVNIRTGERERALVVPNDAVLHSAGGSPAVLRVAGGNVQAVPVTIGLQGVTLTEIVSGLRAGDVVLADATATDTAALVGERVRPDIQPVATTVGNAASGRELPVAFD